MSFQTVFGFDIVNTCDNEIDFGPVKTLMEKEVSMIIFITSYTFEIYTYFLDILYLYSVCRIPSGELNGANLDGTAKAEVRKPV